MSHRFKSGIFILVSIMLLAACQSGSAPGDSTAQQHGHIHTGDHSRTSNGHPASSQYPRGRCPGSSLWLGMA